MDPQYDFLSTHREQLLVQAKINQMLQKRGNNQVGLRGKIFSRLGDVLISSGTWFKKSSRSPANENSVTIYSQYY